jgi:uncharacterized membrane protein YfcA
MEIYLPIAEISVNWVMVLAMGAAVGFLSGMFGIGGGFLMTPLLIFYGIPPSVAVATQASHMSASAISGVLARFRQRGVDLKMGAVLVVGGLIGAGLGVYIFALLEKLGQIELTISASYVLLLGSIGILMLNESLRALSAARRGESLSVRRPGQHGWIHGLPFKLRFHRSKLYFSVLPPLVLGLTGGILASVLGVGGAFIFIPVMVYLFRMPTAVVVGTSQFQLVLVAAASTLLHAIGDHRVDIVLAFLLIAGGVLGAQFGVRVAEKLRGEQLRLLLALLVLAVALRLAIGLVVTPNNFYSVVSETP